MLPNVDRKKCGGSIYRMETEFRTLVTVLESQVI